MSNAGILSQSIKESKRRGLQKLHLIRNLIKTANETRTLTSQSLRQQLLNVIVKTTGPLITIPLQLRQLFQRLELVLGFPSSVGGINDIDNAGFIIDINHNDDKPPLTLKWKVSKCQWIIEYEKISPSEFFIEASSPTVLLSLGRKGLIGNEIELCHASGMALFDDRRSLEMYESAIFVLKVVTTWIEMKKFSEVLELTEAAQQRLEKFIDVRDHSINASKNLLDSNPQFLRRLEHPFLKRLTGYWIWAATLWEIVAVHETYSKDYDKATELIELVIRSGLLTNQRRKMFSRLTINYHYNLHQPQLALEAVVNGLREGKSLPIYCMVEIARRGIRILRTCGMRQELKNLEETTEKKRKRRKTGNEDNESDEMGFSESDVKLFDVLPEDVKEIVKKFLEIRTVSESSVPKNIVFGKQLKSAKPKSKESTNLTKAWYINDKDEIQGVESFALDWYNSSHECIDHGWLGVHDEGGILRDIFTLLMVDILLDTTVPDAFIVPTQTAPLDLYTDVFYTERRDAIENRLSHLSQLSPYQLFLESLSCCSATYPSGVLTLTWRWLDVVASTRRGRRWWEEYRKLLDMNFIVAYCSQQDNPRLLGRLSSTPINASSKSSYPSPAQTPKIVRQSDTQSIRSEHQSSNPVSSSYMKVSSYRSPISTSPITSPPSGNYRNNPLKINPIDQIVFISSIIAGLGSYPLVIILRTFSQAFAVYKSGLPDLFLWKTPKREQTPNVETPYRSGTPNQSCRSGTPNQSCRSGTSNQSCRSGTPNQSCRSGNPCFPILDIKMVEVKSENDRLSEKQRQWLAILLDAGLHVELFCVQGKMSNIK